MKNLGRGNYRTDYSCVCPSAGIDKTYLRQACFGAIFRSVGDIANYVVYIHKDSEYGIKNQLNHNCLFSKEEIERHLNNLKRVVPLRFKVEEGHLPHSNAACYEIKLRVKGNNIYHRYILTWVRFLYEYPYNVILKDAYRLKSVSGFKNISIQALNAFCTTAFPGYVGVGHGYARAPKYITLRTLKNNLQKVTELNDIYSEIAWKDEDKFHLSFPNPEDEDLHDKDYWLDEENFKVREKLYKEIFAEYRKYE